MRMEAKGCESVQARKNVSKDRWFVCVIAIIAISQLEVALAEEGVLGPLKSYIVAPLGSRKILPASPADPGERSDSLVITACRGEYEPGSIVLLAGANDVRKIGITISDLVHDRTGAVIPATEIDVRVVKPWFQSVTSWSEYRQSATGGFRQALVPELLLKDDSLVVTEEDGERNLVKVLLRGQAHYQLVNPKKLVPDNSVQALEEFPVRDSKDLQLFTVPARTGKQLWITIRVPETAVAGDYKSEVQVKSGAELLGRINVRLRVLPFTLDDPSIAYSIYYRGKLDPRLASIGSEYKTVEQVRNEAEDMRRHGVSNPTLYQSMADRQLLRATMEIRRAAGLTGGPLYFLGIETTDSLGRTSLEQANTLRRRMPEILALARSFGYGQVYVYGRDEAKGPELSAQRDLWQLVHQLGGRVFVAGSTGAHALVGEVLDLFVHFGQPDFREAERWHRSGQKIFNYANPQTGPESPYLFRLNYGLMLWANDYDGAMPYAYQHCFGSCWNDVDHPIYRDHVFAYPTADGVLPTIAWEGFREAVDDVRYVTTLERLLEQEADAGTKQVYAARTFLRGLREELRVKQKGSGEYNQNIVLDLDVTRSAVVRHINAVYNH